ncbi:hypothetical protein RN001_000927 [Aquatica leii]|uniref:Uncharacterized protein n=1 Tax=Aquatica leii TaxID=1421715 RepID=A0AAN7SCH2_9COLE|nr:hypothetical protein RN001_000927 [Aquatica leii]
MGDVDNDAEKDNDFDIEELQNSLIYKEIQRRKELEKLPKVSKCKLKKALKILKEQPKAKYKTLLASKKRNLQLQKFCINRAVGSSVQEKLTWFSPTYIMELIRTCILTRDWNYVTYLLLMLQKHNKRYNPFIKQITLLMLMSHPNDENETFLNKFLQSCNIRLS